jgi:hypothetical protein
VTALSDFGLRSNHPEFFTRLRTIGAKAYRKAGNDVREKICPAANLVNKKADRSPQIRIEEVQSSSQKVR